MGFKRQKRDEHHIKTHPTLMTYRTTRSAFTRELLSLKGEFLMLLESRAKRKEPKQVILPRMKNEKWFFPLYAVKKKESKKVTLSRMNGFRWLFSLYYR